MSRRHGSVSDRRFFVRALSAMINDMNEQELKKLAMLARVAVTDDELKKLHTDMDSILKYISQIREIADTEDGMEDETKLLSAALREDENPHSGGEYTARLLKSAPKSTEGYIQVKKIIST